MTRPRSSTTRCVADRTRAHLRTGLAITTRTSARKSRRPTWNRTLPSARPTTSPSSGPISTTPRSSLSPIWGRRPPGGTMCTGSSSTDSHTTDSRTSLCRSKQAPMGRAAYIRKRLILTVFVLFGVTILIFGMVHFLPGDPATILLGDRGTQQNVAELRDQLGLNRPLPEQYWMFVSGLVRGQMGTSLVFKQQVSQMVLSRVPISIGLAVYAMGLAALITLVFGLAAAVK